MKLSSIILFGSIFLGFLSLSIIPTDAATDNQIMCPMNYSPVCGTIQVQCITAPCDPVRETFGNSCVAASRHATYITEGACEDTATGILVGGDRDIHGCIGSAGYSWNSMMKKCIRPWEVNAKKSPREALKATWNLVSLDGKNITQSGTITFTRNMIQAKLCNTMRGRYTAINDHINTRGLMSTMMYCEGEIMTVESLLSERGLTYMVGETTLTIETR
jgi:heat shock protein HslJ